MLYYIAYSTVDISREGSWAYPSFRLKYSYALCIKDYHTYLPPQYNKSGDYFINDFDDQRMLS